MRPFYITTPIYYVNDLPHIGHIYTTVVADTLARYQRLAGAEVYLLTGSDEHGQKIERAAQKEGIAPLALADRVVARYHELWRKLGISHDDFIRTTEARHRPAVFALIRRLEAAGDIYSARHEGWYCTACETFYTEKELLPERLCPDHRTPTEWRSEDNVFFRLSRYQQPLLDWYERCPQAVRPATRANEVRAFVAGGLRDLSVSRGNLDWGLPFPERPGQTVYVWLDALTNYISALGFGGEGEQERYRRFWESDGVRLHLVGKDILRHHAVYWPAFLLAAGLPLPTTVFAHGWWLRDDRKMSKSVGNVVRPDELLESFGPDPLRYFLLREMVFGQDATFSDEAFVDRYNSDLANDLGNTISRVVTVTRAAYGGHTPPLPCDDNPLIAVARRSAEEYRAAMDDLQFSRALEALWRLLAEANQYIVAREPWKLAKNDGPSERLSRILWNGLESVRIVAVGLLPFMPEIAARALAAIGTGAPPTSLDALAWGGTPTSVPLPEPQPLFPRIDKKDYLAGGAAAAAPAAAVAPAPSAVVISTHKPAPRPVEEKLAMISIEKFFETELKVATIVAAERVPKSNKLVKLSVELGEETRTVVAGIGKAYTPEELVGKQVVVVANLEPAQLMGVESQGMVLAASEDGVPILLHPDRPVPSGTRVK
jgi:methionyl-tRNA synthetase